MATGKKKGRPPKKETRKSFHVMLTDREREELQAGADADGEDLGPWLRKLGLKRARQLARSS